MTMRYCPTCQAEVQTVDGHCLLGHRVALEPAVPSLEALRAEVDRVFEQARREVAQVLHGSAAPAAHAAAVPPAAPPAGAPTSSAPAAARVPPPPPPADPARALEERRRTVFAALQAEEPLTTADPIVAFAPAPRMDWGPERTGLLRKRAEPAP